MDAGSTPSPIPLKLASSSPIHCFSIVRPDSPSSALLLILFTRRRRVGVKELYCRHQSFMTITSNNPTSTPNQHLFFLIFICVGIFTIFLGPPWLVMADINPILNLLPSFFIVYHHQRRQHTNISAHIISSSMEMLTYLSASSLHLTLSTYDEFP